MHDSVAPSDSIDSQFMARAIELAKCGEGAVEPNPMVGCVLTVDGRVAGEGYHRRYGGPHAEVEALRAAGPAARGATAYVTLEPCCHHGKTPPCVDALLEAGIRRVVVAQVDPFPAVAGRGLERLRAAGVEVVVGPLADQARSLNAPYLHRLRTGRPWVIGKWAMSLDGKIAAASGDSRWISGVESRAFVHALRGKVDGIVVGAGTARIDDPLLTARPPGPRVAARIVLDSLASLRLDSRLVQTAREQPLIVVVGPQAEPRRLEALAERGAECLQLTDQNRAARWDRLLETLGSRRFTNLLVEGGAQLFGDLFDRDAIDELHLFVAPIVIGGAGAPSPVGGAGVRRVAEAARWTTVAWRGSGEDLHWTGRRDARSTRSSSDAE